MAGLYPGPAGCRAPGEMPAGAVSWSKIRGFKRIESGEQVSFIQQNIWLVLIALVSGGVLVWPLISRRISGAAEVGAMEAVQLMNRKDAVMVDLREPAEFGAGHVPNARNIPHAQIEARIGELEKSKGKPIVLVCQTGGKSHAASTRLKKAGFGEVVVLSGGMGAWQQASLPVEK